MLHTHAVRLRYSVALGNGTLSFELLASDVPFVVSPSVLEVECPVCYGLLVDSYLTDCYGHHFCSKCFPKLKKQPCPICKKRFTSIRDQSLQRTILSMETYCMHKAEGCEWTGMLRFLYEDINPAGLEDHGCPYVMICCSLDCGKKFLRSTLE